ncbi:YeeE/YedE family protein [Dethiobacter alkaliphilus]|uniref:Uncharacterized protein n=1 Tax=Dethiobacter alkaliphilus AHT 1 TaxID=555088 RepID=C0GFV8_DETAL|nr:YeeE/YedE family protein [Dethiobacter alkaliphilus]EEG77647.1 protein of unknown function DUF395 YeeE/YedE [Dethiobacter alkaliphilus AHT 1]
MAQIVRDLKYYQQGAPRVLLPAFVGSVALLLFVNDSPVFLPFMGGLFFGYVIQRSRFCFAACFRDVFLLGNTALTRALLVGLALATAGFSAISILSGNPLLEAGGRIYPLGLHTLLGGVLFGFGMVIAGSCVSGCLVRMGEGYLMQWGTFGGLLVGSVLGAWHLNWWLRPQAMSLPAVFLPASLGWPDALLLQFMLLAGLFLLAQRIEQSKNPWQIFKSAAVTGSSWPYGTGAVLLAVGNMALLYLWGRPWGITSGLTHLTGWAGWQLGLPVLDWQFFSAAVPGGVAADSSFLQHPLLCLALAMVLGGFLAAVLNNEFRLRRPRRAKYSYFALTGGILMGYGSRLSFGCNIGALFSGIPSLSLHAWAFFFAVLLGAALGGKVLLRYVMS